MEQKHLSKLKNFLVSSFLDFNVKIVLFGSRARGDYHNSSDVDIAIDPLDNAARRQFILIKEEIENFNTPYQLNIIDLSTASTAIKQEVQKDGIIWKD